MGSPRTPACLLSGPREGRACSGRLRIGRGLFQPRHRRRPSIHPGPAGWAAVRPGLRRAYRQAGLEDSGRQILSRRAREWSSRYTNRGRRAPVCVVRRWHAGVPRTATGQARLGVEHGRLPRRPAEPGVLRIAAGGWRPAHRHARRAGGGRRGAEQEHRQPYLEVAGR